MKKTSIIVESILALAIIVLFVLHFKSASSSKKEVANDKNVSGIGTIAYVKLDSVVLNYKMAQDMQAQFSRKQEAYNSRFGAQKNNLIQQESEFQEKVQHGGFISQDKALQERNRLMAEEQKVKQMDFQLSNDLSKMQQDNNKKLQGVIDAFLKEYNKKHHYTYILNGAAVMIGQDGHNITKDVLAELNKSFTGIK